MRRNFRQRLLGLSQVKAGRGLVRNMSGDNRGEASIMYSKILVPVDLAETELAGRALDAATSFALASNGHVRLVYVQPFVPLPYMEFVPANFDTEQKAQSEEALAKAAASLKLPKGQVSAKVLNGSIHSAVLDEAKDWGADLIVVWSHRPGLAAYLIGSNAATIVRHATCSVLVCR